MRTPYGYCWALVLHAAVVAELSAQVSDPKFDAPLTLAHQAWLSTANVSTGGGFGTFTHRAQQRDSEREQAVHGKISAYYKAEKYHIALQFETAEAKLNRKVIICDGSAIFVGSFWKTPRDFSEGEAHHLAGNNRHPIQIGFPWDVSRPYLVHVDGLLKNRATIALSVTQLPGDGFRGTYHTGPESYTTFDFFLADGFNISEKVAYHNKAAPPMEKYKVAWQRNGSNWFVNSISIEEDLSYSGHGHQHWQIKYTSYVPNSSVPDSLFTLDALKLHEGSRILDHRPGAPNAVFLYTKSLHTQQESLDTMLAELHKLPARAEHPVSDAQVWVRVTVSALLILFGSLLILRYFQKRRST